MIFKNRQAGRVFRGVFRNGSRVLESVLDAIVSDYAPDILLDFNQEAGFGSTIPDVSGNERDFTADGTEGVDFTWKGNTGHLANTPGRIEMNAGATWTSDTAFTGSHSFVVGTKADMAGALAVLYGVDTDRLEVGAGGAGIGGLLVLNAGTRFTSYDGGADNEFLIGLSHDPTDAKLFINGLLMESLTGGARSIGIGSIFSIGSRGDGTIPAAGDYEGFGLYKNAALTDDEQYDIAQRAGAVPEAGHWFKEVVQDELGVDGNCEIAHPAWEIDGADAMDVSGNGNHGAYISGPSLGQPPIGEGALYSIGLTGVEYIQTPNPFNSGAAYTLVMRVKTTDTSGNQIVFDCVNGTALFRALIRNDPDRDLTFAYDNGSGSTTVGTFTDVEFVQDADNALVLRSDGSTLNLWLNGVKSSVSSNISGVVMPDMTGGDWRFGEGFGGSGVVGNIGLPHVFNAALNDAQCARLSGGAALDVYPTLDLKAGTNITGTSPVTAWSSDVGQINVNSFSNAPDRSPGGGVELNGTNEHITLTGTLSDYVAITETGVFSFGARVRIDDLSDTTQCIFQTKGAGRGVFVGFDGTANQVEFIAFNAANSVLYQASVDLGALGYTDGDEVVLSFIGDGTNCNAYADATLADTVAIAKQAGAHQFLPFVGRYTTIGSGYFDGAINGLFFEPVTRPVAAIQGALNA